MGRTAEIIRQPGERMNMKDQLRRYGIFLIGLFTASMGVAFSTRAGLGTSPVSSVPYSVSLVNDALTFGWWLNLWSVLQILVTVALLRSKCRPLDIAVQTVLAFVYGYLTDFSCRLLSGVSPESYPARFCIMLVGCVVLALGIWIQYKGGVAMLPGEAMNRAVSQVTGKRYENVKIFFDVVYILLSAAVCLLFVGELQGVREGSVVAALLIGNIIKLYNRLFDRLTGKGKAVKG